MPIVHLLLTLIYKVAPLAGVSGSEDGTVRLWDLLTGACAHKLHSHVGAVTQITATQTYVVSTGLDDSLCIWDRSKGTQLHALQMVFIIRCF